MLNRNISVEALFLPYLNNQRKQTVTFFVDIFEKNVFIYLLKNILKDKKLYLQGWGNYIILLSFMISSVLAKEDQCIK